MLAIGVVVLIALDIPAKAERAAGSAVGHAGFTVSGYQIVGLNHMNRAKVDVNRNDKWDEKYTFDGEKITLQRAPNDDESYTETYHWNGSGWTRE